MNLRSLCVRSDSSDVRCKTIVYVIYTSNQYKAVFTVFNYCYLKTQSTYRPVLGTLSTLGPALLQDVFAASVQACTPTSLAIVRYSEVFKDGALAQSMIQLSMTGLLNVHCIEILLRFLLSTMNVSSSFDMLDIYTIVLLTIH
jgi:hypothetical protein